MNCPIHYDLLYLRRLVVWPAFDAFGQGGLCYVTVPVTTKQQHSSNFKCMLLGVYLSIKAKIAQVSSSLQQSIVNVLPD